MEIRIQKSVDNYFIEELDGIQDEVKQFAGYLYVLVHQRFLKEILICYAKQYPKTFPNKTKRDFLIKLSKKLTQQEFDDINQCIHDYRLSKLNPKNENEINI